MREETYVFIDAGYLSKISKHLGHGNYIQFDVNRFAVNMADIQDMDCKGVYYYLAPPFQGDPPTPEEAGRKSRHDKFVSKLRNIPGFIVREGRCQKVEGEYFQKGVDTLLTMDLFEICSRGDIRAIVILTCDTDFVPILNRIRGMGIKVILYYYSDFIRGSRFSMSNHILTACDKKVCIDLDLFKKSKREE
jgi:uncharacterized LabA/DUF88 family protein